MMSNEVSRQLEGQLPAARGLPGRGVHSEICCTELERFGEISTGLLEILNTRFHNSLGIEKLITFINGEVNLMSPGDILILLTDGLADHQRGNGQSFVPVLLGSALRRVKHLAAKGIFEDIYNAATAFSPPEDDVSIVVLKRRGSEGDS
jgi:hypothetical protein